MANLSIVDRTHSKMLNFMVVLLIHGLNFQKVKRLSTKLFQLRSNF